MSEHNQPFGGIPGEIIAFLLMIPIGVILALIGWAFDYGPFAKETEEHKAQRQEQHRQNERAKGEAIRERINGIIEGHKP